MRFEAIARQSGKIRLDQVIVERGLARSRQAAQALVMSGRVSVDGRVLEKSGALVARESDLRITPPERVYASRGGIKLAGALDAFGVEVRGLTALDVGASTGGFTDCMLQRGAARVVALDVGHGQIDWTLRNDPRVIVVEGVNARHLDRSALPPDCCRFDIITIDVSFISLRLIIPPVVSLQTEPREENERDWEMIVLVKPQFEAGRKHVGRGGIVRDPVARRASVVGVCGFVLDLGLRVTGITPSPIRGAEGNHEYFIRLGGGSAGDGLTQQEIEDHVAEFTRDEAPAD